MNPRVSLSIRARLIQQVARHPRQAERRGDDGGGDDDADFHADVGVARPRCECSARCCRHRRRHLGSLARHSPRKGAARRCSARCERQWLDVRRPSRR